MARSTASWREVGFDEAFQRLKLKAFEIPTKDYQVTGTYPIIDQGDGDIAGYIDREDPISDVPFIVFGDHTTIVKYVDQPCFIGSQGVVPLKARECYDPYFLYLMLGRTRIPALGYSRHFRELENKTFPLPPLAEQRKIAEILRTWDEAIETAEAELKAKQERKRGLMQRVFEGAFQSISQGWNKVLLGDCFFERSETGNAGLPLLSITSGNGVVDREEIGRRDTSAVDKSKYLRICPGDIGYNTMRMWQGVCGLSKHEGIVSPAYTILRPRSETNPAFMYYLFKCPPMISRFHRRSQGLVKDTLNLKFPAFAKISVNIPSQKEQAKIVQILEAADEEVEWLKRHLESLRTQKRGLMQKLLTGEVRVAA